MTNPLPIKNTPAVSVPDAQAFSLRHLWFPLLVLTVSLVITFFFWRTIERATVERAEQIFQAEAQEISSQLIKRLHDHEQVLLGANALFHVEGDAVTRQDWQSYVAALKLEENHPGILGVGYSAWLPRAQKDAHIASIRAEGFPDYAIRPAGERPAYTAIVWLEPFDWRNQRAFGYDMYSEPVRRRAMDRARDTGATSIAAGITLVQETEQDTQSGILMYVPSYRRDLPAGTLEERHLALRGFVYSPIRVNDFVTSTLTAFPDNIDFEIHAGTGSSPSVLLFSSGVFEKRVLPADYRPVFVFDKVVEDYGVSWRFAFKTLPAFDTELNRGKSYSTLFTGILSSILLSVLAFVQARSRRQAMVIAEQMVAARKTAEEAKAAAEQASQAKSDFLSTMSHEIRTPMTVFMGAVEQLLLIDKNSQHRQLLELASQASRRLHILVNEILDFSKIEAKRVDLDENWFNLGNCLREAMGMLAGKAGERGLHLELEVADDVPENIVGDQYRLGQILLNLIGNAIKFTDRGEVRVAVVNRGDHLVFTVSDTGIGIPGDKLGKIFDTFSQVDSSSTRRHGGTGLGLAISKGLVELMGGEISVRSQLGQGSQFVFTLPLKRKLLVGVDPAPGGGSAGVDWVPQVQVLLVEDNPMIRELVLMYLSRRSWPTTIAENGSDAIAKWQGGDYDLVLMDLQMPDMDGLEATRQIRQLEAGRESRTVIIGLTAHASRNVLRECIDCGMNEVLIKPFESARLYAVIDQYLAQ